MLSNLKTYYRPKSIPEALALLEKNSGSILFIAGGTKLVQSDNAIVRELVDIMSLDLNYIQNNKGELRIGATTSIQKLVESPDLRTPSGELISKAALLSHRSKMVRNQATLGGELVSSGPLSVLYCAMLVLQGQVRIAGGDEFALAMNIFLRKKGLGGGLLIETIIPRFSEHTYAAIVPIHHENENALVCACARVTFEGQNCSDVKIAVTATERLPRRFPEAEHVLEGNPLTIANIESASETASQLYRPISDDLASGEYRKEVCRGLVKKALQACVEQFEEDI